MHSLTTEHEENFRTSIFWDKHPAHEPDFTISQFLAPVDEHCAAYR